MGEGVNRIRLAVVQPPPPGAMLTAIVPIDGTLPTRLTSLAAFWRLLEGRDPCPADPLTAQRRHRLKAMLLAWDARGGGAAYREIAATLYGPARVADTPWKSSSLRDATMRLVRDGARLVRGGYRTLMR